MAQRRPRLGLLGIIYVLLFYAVLIYLLTVVISTLAYWSGLNEWLIGVAILVATVAVRLLSERENG